MKNFCTNTIALLGLTTALTGVAPQTASADIVHLDDVIISFSLCIGNDCVNGESFGFDTLRLKENNLRINFDDTSSSASFPSNDWRIMINDSSNGGGNYFGIEDSSGGRMPFRIEAGAIANALYVDSGGDVGIGTSTPAVELHAVDGNTPTLRLEQNGSSGFAAQTWDVAGNETNFFVRDVTNSSRLPFRIRPSAPTSSIDIADDGDVGFGTSSPTAPLHISRSGVAHIKLDDTSGEAWSMQSNSGEFRITNPTEAGVEFAMDANANITLANDGTVVFLSLKNSTETWSVQNNNSDLRLTNPTFAGVEFALQQDGGLTIAGALTQNSDKANKMAIEPVDARDILQRVAALPISSWSYKHDAEEGIRHIGPMAQDFYAAFGTGNGPTGISTIDTGGVALAAIKALQTENDELQARIYALETRFDD